MIAPRNFSPKRDKARKRKRKGEYLDVTSLRMLRKVGKIKEEGKRGPHLESSLLASHLNDIDFSDRAEELVPDRATRL